MKIPKSLKIHGLDVTVVKVPGMSDETDNVGLYDSTRNIIFLDAGLNKKEMYQTFLHEVGHALLFRIGFHHLAGLNDDMREIIVDNFATVFSELK